MIDRYESRKQAFDVINSYPSPFAFNENASKKVKILEGVEYYKLGSKIVKHSRLWVVSRFFKAVGLSLINALCSKDYRKLAARTWQEFKNGYETKASIYVKKQLAVNKEATDLNSSSISLESIRKDHERLNQYLMELLENVRDQRSQAKKSELLNVVSQMTTEEMQQFLENKTQCKWRHFLTLFTLKDQLTLSNDTINKITKRVDEDFGSQMYLTPQLNTEEIKGLSILIPFHPALLEHFKMAPEQNIEILKGIFSGQMTIPDEFLQKSLSLILEILRYKGISSDPVRDIFLKFCQEANLNAFPVPALEKVLLLSEELKVPLKIERIENEKLIQVFALLKNQAKHALLIHLVANVESKDERYLKLALLFSQLTAQEVFNFLHRSQDLNAYKYVLWGNLDTTNEICRQKLKNITVAFRVIWQDAKEEDIQKIKQDLLVLFEEATFDQLILLNMDCQQNPQVYTEVLISKAVDKDKQKLVNDETIENLGKYLSLLPSGSTRESFIQELVRQNKLVSILEQQTKHLTEDVFKVLTIDDLKALIQFYAENDEAIFDFSKELDETHLLRLFTLLYEDAFDLSKMEMGPKLLECFNEVVNRYPDEVPQVMHVFVSKIGEAITLPSQPSLQELEVKKNLMEQSLKFIDELLVTHPQIQEDVTQYFTGYNKYFLNRNLTNKFSLLKRAIVSKHSPELALYKIKWLLTQFPGYEVTVLFNYLDKKNQDNLVLELFRLYQLEDFKKKKLWGDTLDVIKKELRKDDFNELLLRYKSSSSTFFQYS